jgi:PKD repeat protein
MTTMGKRSLGLTIAAAALMLSAACTTSQTEVPGLTGPSELALSVRMFANPDSISQDGASQSAVVVTVFDASGKPCPNVPLRIEMAVGQQIQDFGTLNARTIVTGTDGKATVTYTAPPPPPPLAGGSGNTVTILATPSGSANCNNNQPVGNFEASNRQQVSIRLVRPGVILPQAETPHAKFTFTPSPVNLNTPTNFDASTSCPGNEDNNGNCVPGPSVIASYSWDFGDGGTGTGRTATHTFRTLGTFNVTLTVTNDRGIAASATQPVTTAVTQPPTGDWVFSPVPPVVNGEVIFNADAIRAAAGHTIAQYSWDFGDGGTGSGVVTRHTFTSAGTFTVVLSVIDDVGQKATITKAVTVGTANPTAKITLTNSGPKVVTADASASTAVGSSQIVNYTFAWGDGSPSTSSTAAVVQHVFPSVVSATYVVTLTVTDNASPPRTGTVTASVTVP